MEKLDKPELGGRWPTLLQKENQVILTVREECPLQEEKAVKKVGDALLSPV